MGQLSRRKNLGAKMIKGFVEKPKRHHFVNHDSYMPLAMARQLNLWHGGDVRPMLDFLRKENKKDLIGVEIGVLHGINAVNILNNLSIEKLYLIDPLQLYPDYKDIRAPVFNWVKKDADARLKPFLDKIVWLIKFSSEAKSEIPDNLDFVYIDGNHAYEYCLEDIKNYYPKVKKGGIIGGHDYTPSPAPEPVNFGVRKAVDEFASKNNLKLFHQSPDWWIIK